MIRATLIAFGIAGLPLALINVPLFTSAPAEDSFFTLTPLGRLGLVLLSAGLIVVCFKLLAAKTALLRRKCGRTTGPARAGLVALDVALGWLIYLLLHHLSPQIYYGYYMTLFDGLPLQWVVGWPEADRLAEIALPGPKVRLSDFLACAGFWAVLPFTLLLHRDLSARG